MREWSSRGSDGPFGPCDAAVERRPDVRWRSDPAPDARRLEAQEARSGRDVRARLSRATRDLVPVAPGVIAGFEYLLAPTVRACGDKDVLGVRCRDQLETHIAGERHASAEGSSAV
jgi:hypothetical protein